MSLEIIICNSSSRRSWAGTISRGLGLLYTVTWIVEVALLRDADAALTGGLWLSSSGITNPPDWRDGVDLDVKWSAELVEGYLLLVRLKENSRSDAYTRNSKLWPSKHLYHVCATTACSFDESLLGWSWFFKDFFICRIAFWSYGLESFIQYHFSKRNPDFIALVQERSVIFFC